MTLRLGRQLPDRAVPPDSEGTGYALNYQVVPALKEVIRALTAPPAEVGWTEGVATLDVGSNNMFILESLTQNSVIMLSGAFDGAQGTIWVPQDAVGGWTLDIVADARTVMRYEPDVDSDPDPDPSSLTRYDYTFLTIGIGYLILERHFLL